MLKPDVSTIEAVRATIAAAKSVALTDPAGGAPIGRHIMDVSQKFGFREELRARVKPVVGSGEDVAIAVEKGEADIGITLNSEIASVRGVAIGGTLPPEMQLQIIGYGVVTSNSRHSGAGQALIDFMLSSASKKTMKEAGIEPPRDSATK